MAFPLPTSGGGIVSELAIYPQDDVVAGSIANGQNATQLLDYSGKSRTIVGTSAYPIYQIPSINSKAGVLWNGTKNPLKNAAPFTVKCGFMVVRVDETTNFANYAGILTDTASFPILVGNQGTPYFYDNQQESYLYEYRMNDRIYSRDAKTLVYNAPAPMNAYKIIFFRYWSAVTVNGIQIGQDRADTSRKAKMSLALLALYSTDFCESEIRKHSQTLADTFAIPLADVFPYQADSDSIESDAQSANIDFPSSGGQIAEVLDTAKMEGDLKFTNRAQLEVKTAQTFLLNHYAQAGFIYRSYQLLPPRDHYGYATSLIEHSGNPTYHNKAYGFGFKEN